MQCPESIWPRLPLPSLTSNDTMVCDNNSLHRSTGWQSPAFTWGFHKPLKLVRRIFLSPQRENGKLFQGHIANGQTAMSAQVLKIQSFSTTVFCLSRFCLPTVPSSEVRKLTLRGVWSPWELEKGGMSLKHCRMRTWIHLFVTRNFLNQRKEVFKKTLAKKISLLWLDDSSCLFISLCQT